MQYNQTDTARQHAVIEDYRGPFGRDRDRILYSSAFRRLAGKTQVVAVGELGDFHTRMTHTLKVAQIGRRLAERLQRQAIDAGIGTAQDLLAPCSPDLMEAACLAHDLGHPPFGHAGEEALMRSVDKIVADRATTTPVAFGGFEGNAQTFRILGYLGAVPPSESRGLNLSRATLDSTVKYPWDRGEDGKPAKKWNAYPQDAVLAEWVRDDHGWGPGSPLCFEAQLMDWCDDVAYATHDVEDFFRAGVIPLHELFTLRSTPHANGSLSDETQRFFAYLAKKWGENFDLAEATAVWTELAQFYLIPGAYQPTREIKVAVHRATSQVITHLLAETRWVGDAPMRYQGSLAVDAVGQKRRRLGCDLLQQLIWFYVIERPALASQQYGQQRIVHDLLSIFADPDNRRLLPAERHEQLDDGVDPLRVAVDHVASLTEPRAEALHLRLTGIRVGQHSDPIW